MNLKRVSILMLLCAATLAIASYESYRSNAEFVHRLAGSEASQAMFEQLQPGIPLRSKVTGFFAVMLGVAGVKLLFSGFHQRANGDPGSDMLQL